MASISSGVIFEIFVTVLRPHVCLPARFRAAWLNQLQQGTASDLHYRDTVEIALENLAEDLENALDIDALLKDANFS